MGGARTMATEYAELALSRSCHSNEYANKMNYLDGLKWKLPGWKIEQRYSSGVLIGNWSEDRFKFYRGSEFGNSTNREVFRPYCLLKYSPDCLTRRKGLLRSDGLSKQQLLTHHGDSYAGNTISLYDQTFNRQYTLGPRNWNGKYMAWLPEKSDHPMQGEATNYGLKQSLEEKWKRQQEMDRIGDFNSTAQLSYKAPPTESLRQPRRATDRCVSCRTHPLSFNRDLRLRGKHQTLFKEIVDQSFVDEPTVNL